MGVELREKKLPSGNRSLILDTYWLGRRGPGGRRGRREIRATGYILSGDKKQDKETMLKAEALLAKERLEFEARSGDASPSTFKRMSFNDYMRELIETKDTTNTRRSWEHALAHFERFMESHEQSPVATFGDLTRERFERFKVYLLRELDSPNSALTYFTRVKSALTQAVRDGKLATNPAQHITIKGVKTLPVYLTLQEVQTLANTPANSQNVKNAFLFGCFTGLRISDIQALTWDKIRDGYLEFNQQKTGTPERLPLSEQAKEILGAQKQISNNGHVFVLPTTPAIDGQLLVWAKAAGIVKRLSTHKARHTFATLALSHDVDVRRVQTLLGHKNISTTMIYAEVTDERKAEAVAMMPRIHLTSPGDRSL